MAFKFQVLSGIHYDEHNRKHVRGEVFESEHELDKVPALQDRLKRVGEHDKELDLGDLHSEEIKRAESRAQEAKNKELPKVVEDERRPKGKVKSELPADKAGRPTAQKDTDDDSDDDSDDSDDAEDTTSRAQKKAQQLGDDVTNKFPAAKKKGVTVHVTEEGDYQIAKKGTLVEGGETLARSGVSKFLKKLKKGR